MTTHDDTVTIRRAGPADAAALERLALLDGAPRPLGAEVLLAEAGGEPRAALALADGRAVADPFHPTAHLVALLRTRAAPVAGTRSRGLRRSRIGLHQATSFARVRLVMQPTDRTELR